MELKKWLGVAALTVASLLSGCGGGGGGSTTATTTDLPLMVDSYGQALAETSFGGGDSGAAGADGAAGDGAPIVNAAIKIVDNAGHSVSGKTDAKGVYHLRIDGFVPPMIAVVTRADGSQWVSPSVAAPKVRGFITLSVSGLTDKLASDVAIGAGKLSAAELTPALLAAHASALNTAKISLRNVLRTDIVAVGLDAGTFDPVTMPLVTNHTGYDLLLDNLTITNGASSPTVINPKYDLGGTVTGLNLTGLSLRNGAEVKAIAANATSFGFSYKVAEGDLYNVTVETQPNGLKCTVSNGIGLMEKLPVSNVAVTCAASTKSSFTTTSSVPLDQAKAFMGALRSNVKALNTSDVTLQSSLQEVADDFSNTASPLVQANIEVLELAKYGAQFYKDVVQTNGASFVATKSFSKKFNEFLSCNLYSDSGYTTLATSKANALYVACGTGGTDNVFYPNSTCTSVGQTCSTNWSMRVRLHPDGVTANKFTLYTQTRKTEFQLINTSTFATQGISTNYGDPFPGNAASFVFSSDATGKQGSFSLMGSMSPAYVVTQAAAPYYDSVQKMWVYPRATAALLGDKQIVNLSGSASQSGNLATITLQGGIELIKANAVASTISIGSGSSYKANLKASDNQTQAQDGSDTMNLNIFFSAGQSAFTGQLALEKFTWDKSATNYSPAMMTVDGTLQKNGIVFFTGALKLQRLNPSSFNMRIPRSSLNPEATQMDFTGAIKIPTRDDVNLTFSVANKNIGSGNMNRVQSGQYSQGGLVVDMTGTGSVFNMQSKDGVLLQIDQTKLIWPITKNGQQLGQIASKESKISYIDGSYEQY